MDDWVEPLWGYIGAPCTTLAFDPEQDLIWTGSQTGHVASWFTEPPATPELLGRYTSFRGHKAPVKDVLVDQRGVLSIAQDSLKFSIRRGLQNWHRLAEEGGSFSSMCYSASPGADLLASYSSPAKAFGISSQHGHEDIVEYNSRTGAPLRRISCDLPVVQLKRSSTVCCGHMDGQVTLRDPKTLSVQHTFQAHSGGLASLEVAGNLLFSIGYTVRSGTAILDPLVKVFDLRAFRLVTPIPFPNGPAFLKVHPRLSSSIFVASPSGSIHNVDTSNPAATKYLQVDTTSYLSSMSISPNGDFLGFGMEDGYFSLYSRHPDARSSKISRPVELADSPEELPSIEWTDETPLSSIGLPYNDGKLLSDIPLRHYATRYSPLFDPPPPIDPNILASMKVVDNFVGYARLPHKMPRNQVRSSQNNTRGRNRRLDVPLFRSEQSRKALNGHHRALSDPDKETFTGDIMPTYYQLAEIRYSRFGVEDFDFGFYNKTSLSGLETHITNCYTNAALQALRFLPPFAHVAQSHAMGSCPKEQCILCELGFLFRMLRDAKGANCQATNFLRVFGSNTQATALGLMDYEDASIPYSTMIQLFIRFTLEQSISESDIPGNNHRLLQDTTAQAPSPVAQLMRISQTLSRSCQKCGAETLRELSSSVLDLVYPDTSSTQDPHFPTLLRNSLNRDDLGYMFCSSCHSQSTFRAHRSISASALPTILTLNSGVRTPNEFSYWTDRDGHQFLPRVFYVSDGPEGLDVWNGLEERVPADPVAYELRGLVVQIQTDEDTPHLVALVKVPSDYPNNATGDEWYLFNDFLVRQITEEEALSFRGGWKIPAILFFQRTDYSLKLDAIAQEPDFSVLFQDENITRFRDQIYHQPLLPSELPQPGTLVSIDAEFVCLQHEEVDYFSNGTRKVLRPSRMTLARVSVLRGQGPLTGVPFIDDYIVTREPVVDYLTEFSGIRPGDLDEATSRKTLVTLKTAYKKLRLLIGLGVKFIGHGLDKDLRTINIHIPRGQIFDTVSIYSLPGRQRKLSLRFLAWVVLQKDIQSQGTHDSIEDAKTALQLYEEYSKLEATGLWDDKLEEIYREGKRLGFRAPTAGDVSSPHGERTAPPSPFQPAGYQTPPRFYPPQGTPPRRQFHTPSPRFATPPRSSFALQRLTQQ